MRSMVDVIKSTRPVVFISISQVRETLGDREIFLGSMKFRNHLMGEGIRVTTIGHKAILTTDQVSLTHKRVIPSMDRVSLTYKRVILME